MALVEFRAISATAPPVFGDDADLTDGILEFLSGAFDVYFAQGFAKVGDLGPLQLRCSL